MDDDIIKVNDQPAAGLSTFDPAVPLKGQFDGILHGSRQAGKHSAAGAIANNEKICK